jgi:hypothetical protein
MRVMKDVLLYKKPSRIDALSEKRGLHFTLDGIHLNSKGAQIVAESGDSSGKSGIVETLD